VNLNAQRDHGLEIEPTVQLGKKLTVRAFYAYVTGAITTRTEGGTDTTYYNLIRRPRHSIGIHTSYRLSPALFVSAGLQTFSRRTDAFYDPLTYEVRQTNLAAYQLLNLYAQYQWHHDRLRFFLDIRNALNTRYTEVYGYSTQGRNFSFGFSFTY
jgi:vitamin B12 transporter